MSFQDEFLGEFWQSWGRIPISVSVSCRGGGRGGGGCGGWLKSKRNEHRGADRKSANCMTVARMIAVEGNEKAMKLSRWKVYR